MSPNNFYTTSKHPEHSMISEEQVDLTQLLQTTQFNNEQQFSTLTTQIGKSLQRHKVTNKHIQIFMEKCEEAQINFSASNDLFNLMINTYKVSGFPTFNLTFDPNNFEQAKLSLVLMKQLIEKGTKIKDSTHQSQASLPTEYYKMLWKSGFNHRYLVGDSENPDYADWSISEASTLLMYLLNKKLINVNTQFSGITALNCLAYKECETDEDKNTFTQLVKTYKANLNQAGNDGFTPLHRAASCLNYNTTQILLSLGANSKQMSLNSTNQKMNTAQAKLPPLLSTLDSPFHYALTPILLNTNNQPDEHHQQRLLESLVFTSEAFIHYFQLMKTQGADIQDQDSDVYNLIYYACNLINDRQPRLVTPEGVSSESDSENENTFKDYPEDTLNADRFPKDTVEKLITFLLSENIPANTDSVELVISTIETLTATRRNDRENEQLDVFLMLMNTLLTYNDFNYLKQLENNLKTRLCTLLGNLVTKFEELKSLLKECAEQLPQQAIEAFDNKLFELLNTLNVQLSYQGADVAHQNFITHNEKSNHIAILKNHILHISNLFTLLICLRNNIRLPDNISEKKALNAPTEHDYLIHKDKEKTIDYLDFLKDFHEYQQNLNQAKDTQDSKRQRVSQSGLYSGGNNNNNIAATQQNLIERTQAQIKTILNGFTKIGLTQTAAFEFDNSVVNNNNNSFK